MKRFKYLFVGAVFLHLLTLWFDVGSTSYEVAIAPLALGLIGAAGGQVLGSIANSIIGNSQAKSNAQYSMNMQKDLMDYSWNKYNSPSAQAKAYSDAGFNPSVAFGQGGMSAPIAPSIKSPEVSTAPVPFDTGLQNLPNAVLAASEAKKAGLEAEGQKLLNDYNTQTMAERVRSVALANHWTEENTTKVIQDWSKTIGEINILEKDAAIKQIDLDKHSKLVDSLIDSYAAKANFDNEQTHQLREQLPLILDKLKNEVDILSVDADIANSYKETTATLGVVGQGIKILQTLLKILK